MREIKFRAWVQDGCMVSVDLIDWHEKYIVHEDLAFTDMGTPEPKEPDCVTELKDAVLMQYTGLNDKKRTKEFPDGQPIYEGDIIENGSGRLCKVTWWDYSGQWEATPVNTKGNHIGFPAQHWKANVRVIGNIHENPELLP